MFKAATKTTYIIGRQPVLEAMNAGKQLDRIYIQKNIGGEIIFDIRKAAQALQIPVNVVPPEKLNSISRANHQGVIAVAGLVKYMDLQQVIDHTHDQGETPLFIMLDGITDVRNIGAIARSALCSGAQAIVIPDKGVGAINEEAIKSSAGALHNIHICREESLLKAIDTMHLNGIRVFTAEMKSERNFFDMPWNEPCCIILGSEDKGIQPYLVKASDEAFTIPMSGKFDSLM
jgi:23S rRNA (guanosine2251-2'-O)-methyltransferase